VANLVLCQAKMQEAYLVMAAMMDATLLEDMLM
jgi:hypothetical protein